MPNIVRFGAFELDLETADLTGKGPRLRLPEQQFQILRMLLERGGGVVSREEIRRRLWPDDTIVEFDGSINAAILKLRSALRGEPNDEGLIETVARRGYRLMVPIHNGAPSRQATVETPSPDLIEGETLQDLILRFSSSGGSINRRPPLFEVMGLAIQLAEELNSLHSAGIVHGYIRPANVFVTPGGKVRFGSRLAEQSLGAVTATGQAPAHEDYISPEQLMGGGLDQRSDQFCLGIVLAELLNGFYPFRKTSMGGAREAILKETPNLSGDLPQGLTVLIRRLLAKSIELRYPSIAETLADLERFRADLSAVRGTSVSASIPLIGRDLECAELKRLLNEALVGRGSMVMIGGEPGIGKTHLATAILEEARHRGAFGVIGHCYEMEGAPPYVPFVEMLEYISRTAPREGFRHSLGDDAPEVARLVPELRNIYPDIPPPIQLPPEQQRRFLFNAFRSYVEKASRVTQAILSQALRAEIWRPPTKRLSMHGILELHMKSGGISPRGYRRGTSRLREGI